MHSQRGQRRLLTIVGVVVSLAFGYLAVRDVRFDAFWDALTASEYWWLVPSLAVLAVGVFLRAVRWRLLFARETRPSLGAVTRALLIGYLFNNILPARAGEAARLVALHQDAKTPRAEALGTAITERVYDVVSLLVLLFAASPFLPEVTWIRRAAALALFLAVLVVALVFVLERWRERPVRRVLAPLARIPGISVARTELAAANLVHGLAAFRRTRVAIPAFGLTVVSWLVVAVSFWLAAIGFDLGIGFGAALLVLVATNLAMIIPSSPGALGVFEAVTVVSLEAFGIDESRALSYAVVLHALNFFPYIAVGLFVLHRHTTALRRRSPAHDLALTR